MINKSFAEKVYDAGFEFCKVGIYILTILSLKKTKMAAPIEKKTWQGVKGKILNLRGGSGIKSLAMNVQKFTRWLNEVGLIHISPSC